MVKEQEKEPPLGQNWVFYGQYPGQKTEGLLELRDLHPEGVEVVSGISVGASVFLDCCHGDSNALYNPMALEPLRRINKLMLPQFHSDLPVAFRSSATDERGGNSIYDSRFALPADGYRWSHDDLEEAGLRVYVSYFSEDALAFRRPQELEGMGLLIQPVVGRWYEDKFAPAISGVCTFIEGRPLIRAVIGLGTKAVRLDEAFIFEDGNIDPVALHQGLRKFKFTDVIKKRAFGSLLDIDVSIPKELEEAAIAQAPKLVDLARVWLDYYRGGKPFYWEFVIDPSHRLPVIVQSALEGRYVPPQFELAEPEGAVVCEGMDFLNTGTKVGRGIMLIGSDGDYEQIAQWNRDYPGLVVFTDASMLSGVAEKRLSFQHFSHANALIEIQTAGYHKGVGGTHFAEICKRANVLFLGVPVPRKGLNLRQILGEPTEDIGLFSKYWNIAYKMTNSLTGGRLEILEQPNVVSHAVQIQTAKAPKPASREIPLDQLSEAELAEAILVSRFNSGLETWARDMDNLGFKLARAGRVAGEVCESCHIVAWFIERLNDAEVGAHNFLDHFATLSLGEVRQLQGNLENVLRLQRFENGDWNGIERQIKDQGLENFLFDVLDLCKKRIAEGKT